MALDSRWYTHTTAPSQSASVGGVRFGYRRFGNPIGTPIVLFEHFTGNLDNYDPAITDALASSMSISLASRWGDSSPST